MRTMHREDVLIEIARTERELRARVLVKLSAQQLGEAWVDLVEPEVERRAHEVTLPLPLGTEPPES